MDDLILMGRQVLPLVGTAAGCAVLVWGVHRLLLGRHASMDNERRLPRQVVVLVLALASVVLVVLALPVSDEVRNRLLGLLGLLLSGVLAFSSTTVTANLMAGLMLRFTRPFRVGDFIRVESHFGRVVERGLFDTEVQTEQRDLIALPNTFLITHPVCVVRSSGTAISVSVSLGYDVHHGRVRGLLLRAAEAAGLQDAFVQVLELGNFAVTYRVSGLLGDVKNLLSARSRFHECVLDALHEGGVEIVSPSFVFQRRTDEDQRMIPARERTPAPAAAPSAPEQIVFDKAESAEQREMRREGLRGEIERLAEEAKALKGEERQAVLDRGAALREELQSLEGGEPGVEGAPKA